MRPMDHKRPKKSDSVGLLSFPSNWQSQDLETTKRRKGKSKKFYPLHPAGVQPSSWLFVRLQASLLPGHPRIARRDLKAAFYFGMRIGLIRLVLNHFDRGFGLKPSSGAWHRRWRKNGKKVRTLFSFYWAIWKLLFIITVAVASESINVKRSFRLRRDSLTK